MGRFSKFVKKFTKPISKVLDKVIPNELKPLLPYAAAFAPYMLGPGFGAGFGSGIFSNPAVQKMVARGLFSGGANALSQLSQEGNEGDLNAMSLALSAGQGALTAPGASETLMGARSGELGSQMIQQSPMGPMVSSPTAYIDTSNVGMLGKAKNLGLRGLAKGADFLEKSSKTLRSPGFNKETLMAAAAPISQGTGDLMYQEGVNAERDYEKALREYENSLAEGQFASDSGRRTAIINAMTGNHTQEVIDQTLAELGLRDGGRVNAMDGGIMSNQRMNFAGGGMDAAEPDFGGIPRAIKNVETAKIEDISEIVELDDLSKIEGFAEMLSNMDESDPKYNEIRNM